MANDDSMAWQRQSFSKNGGSSAPCQMNPKLMPQVSGGLHSKIATPTQTMGGYVMGDPKPVAMYADGGEVEALKQEGLAASANDQPVSLWKRLTQGNIDDPKSEAYSAYGAGRGQAERNNKMLAEENEAIAKTTAKAQADSSPKPDMSANKYPDTEFGNLEKAQKDAAARASAPAPAPKPVAKVSAPKPAAPAPVAESKPAESKSDTSKPAGKTFAEDMAERKKATSPVENFDPSKINFGDKKVEPTKEREFKMLRGRKVYLDELPAKSEDKQKVHPRTGRPY